MSDTIPYRVCIMPGCGRVVPVEMGRANTCTPRHQEQVKRQKSAEATAKWRAKVAGQEQPLCRMCQKPFTPPNYRHKYCGACQAVQATPAAPQSATGDADVWPTAQALQFRVPVNVGRLALGNRCRHCNNPLFFADMVCTSCMIKRYQAGRPAEAIKSESRRLA